MFARIIKELKTKNLYSALNSVIDDANHLLNAENYFASFDLYESVYRFLLDSNFENKFSNNITNEFLWCKNGMETCKRYTSTISCDEALANLVALEQDLNKHAAKLDKDKKIEIERVIKTAKAYYDVDRNRANANYLYALNVKKCLNADATHPNIIAIQKLVLLNTENRITISLLRKALKGLSNTYGAYQDEEYTAAVNLLATFNEILADYIVNSFQPSEPNYVAYILEYYVSAIDHWRAINIIPVETYFKILDVYLKIIELKPEQALEQRNNIACFIKINFRVNLTNTLTKYHLDKLDSFKEIAGLKHGQKRTAEEAELSDDIYDDSEEIRTAKKIKFDVDLKNKITAHHGLFISKDNSSDASHTTSEVSRPASPLLSLTNR